jgi:hypothetical protein
MASYEVTIDNGARAKYREPGLVLLWTIITLGIYNWVWYYKINRELRDYGAAHNDDELASTRPGLSLLAVTLGALLIVPPFVSWWRCTRRVQRAQEIAGVPQISFGLIVGIMFGGILITFLWLAAPLLVQEGLNNIWKALPRSSGEPATVDAGPTVDAPGTEVPSTEVLPSRSDVTLPEKDS